MDYIHWRNLVGVSHTEAEVKAMSAEYEYKDGPDDTGEYFMRPGKVFYWSLFSLRIKCQELMLTMKQLELQITEHFRPIYLVYLVPDTVKWQVRYLI
jgi:cytochrome c1